MMPETQHLATTQPDHTEVTGRVVTPVSASPKRKTVFLILLAAFLVNAAIVLVGLPSVARRMAPEYNLGWGDLYNLIARNLDQGNGYRVVPGMSKTMLREPGYPLLLAAVFEFGGYGIQQARAACVILAFGAALMLLRLTRKITGDVTTAMVAALLFLLYPGILVDEAHAGVEIPCVFTVMLFMLALHDAVKKGSLWRYGAAGLLLGVAVMVRSEVLLFPVLLLGYLLFNARDWAERRKAALRTAVVVLGSVAVMSPWIIRNYILVHELVPSATVAGVAAQEGLYTCEHASPAEPFFVAQAAAGLERVRIARRLGIPFVGPYYQLFYTPQGELEFDRALLKGVSDQYRSHPRLLAACGAKNFFFNFWFLGKTPRSVELNMLLQAPLLLLALAGVVILWKKNVLRNAAIVLLYTLYIPAIQAPIIAHARHSTMVVPFVTIFAAAFLVWALRELQAWRKELEVGEPPAQTTDH